MFFKIPQECSETTITFQHQRHHGYECQSIRQYGYQNLQIFSFWNNKFTFAYTPIECSFLHHLHTHDNPKDGGVAKDGNDDHDGEEGVPEEGRGWGHIFSWDDLLIVIDRGVPFTPFFYIKFGKNDRHSFISHPLDVCLDMAPLQTWSGGVYLCVFLYSCIQINVKTFRENVSHLIVSFHTAAYKA